METIEFNCKIITPLFLNGADNKTPELRAQSIKGVMRFWWRALHGHLKLSELHEKEGLIFGNNKRKSCFQIRIINENLKTIEEKIVPHKNYKSPSFKSNQAFKIKINMFKNPYISSDEIQYLFKLSTILGGFGKRSRRGMGVLQINDEENIDIIKVLELIKKFNEKYILEENLVKISAPEYFKNGYPWIKEIRLKNIKTEITQRAGIVSHEINKRYFRDYKNSMGAGSPRFASPVIVTAVNNNQTVVVTTLNTARSEYTQFRLGIQSEFIREILK